MHAHNAGSPGIKINLCCVCHSECADLVALLCLNARCLMSGLYNYLLGWPLDSFLWVILIYSPRQISGNPAIKLLTGTVFVLF
ncbi:hypothetical protein BD410DRAFT_794506 [Rickenella mellea]|uniref:Uncharacterized protein n=1 Tax=Rickenella mellea TaxID=50990 RepID=A0A4Y7PPA7_9AGAM|nr:hypothetical protein BD410DRAFT_794506 [Rickenella mellea]